MQILFFIISIFFIYINYKIIISDLKIKKIPNKYLVFLIYLIPLYYLYLFIELNNINYLIFFLSILFTTFISFILYYFGIWSPGDAKYLLVLSLFIPNIGIIPFIGNIALITLVYLIIYFLYFYIFKIGFNKIYRKSLIKNIIIDHKEKIKIFFSNGIEGQLKKRNIIYKLLKTLIIFLTIFIIIRLSRIYIIESFKDNFSGNNGNSFNLKEFFENNITYILGLGAILTFFIYFIFRRIFSFLFKIIFKNIIGKIFKKDISKKDIGFGFLLIILFFLISFIVYEYKINGEEILNKLYLIFTLYLGFYIIFRILFYSYKLTFSIAENDYINIDELKKGEIIDKEYLIKLFGTQHILGAESKNQNKEGLLYPNPVKYFQNIDNPIDEETANIIKKVYSEVNTYHNKNKTQSFEEKNNIKILKTFAFSYYIFVGFIITFLIQDKIFKYISNIGYNIIKNIYN